MGTTRHSPTAPRGPRRGAWAFEALLRGRGGADPKAAARGLSTEAPNLGRGPSCRHRQPLVLASPHQASPRSAGGPPIAAGEPFFDLEEPGGATLREHDEVKKADEKGKEEEGGKQRRREVKRKRKITKEAVEKLRESATASGTTDRESRQKGRQKKTRGHKEPPRDRARQGKGRVGNQHSEPRGGAGGAAPKARAPW